jgi:DNA-binding cell septation regulator SpoVG
MKTVGDVKVEKIDLLSDFEKRVALATVRLGEVVIRGVAVWKSPRGKLRVFWPSYKRAYGFEDAIALSTDLQADVDAAVIAAYKDTLDGTLQTRETEEQSRKEASKN